MNAASSPAPVDWERSPGAIAWPHGWQRPARTEEWAWEAFGRHSGPMPFSQLVCFPWATLIDLEDRGHTDRARLLLEALDRAPPRTTLVRATVCQHIQAKRIWPRLQALGVTDVFWSHARKDEAGLDGIRIHPFPLYPVRCLDRTEPLADGGPAIVERRLLYSFVGAYAQEGYLTPVRRWIFELPGRSDAFVLRRGDWHYESAVYGEQVARRSLTVAERSQRDRDGAEFDAVLLDSIFSLCPSGSGPNSIRLWESLGFGCIPVLLADTLRLPGADAEWDDAVVRVPETHEAVAALPNRLADIARDPARLRRMRQAGQRLWSRHGERGPLTALGVLADPGWVRAGVDGGASAIGADAGRSG